MFSGIIESVGRVIKLSPREVSVSVAAQRELEKGESVAVNGACLTLVESRKGAAVFSLSPETFRKTNFRLLRPGDFVNVERAMKADGRFSGHFVTGHVDGLARLLRVRQKGGARECDFAAEPGALMAEKGSVALNGISLTVYTVRKHLFSVSVIGHSWEHTNLRLLKAGDLLNIEYDILGKYAGAERASAITMDFIKDNGFS